MDVETTLSEENSGVIWRRPATACETVSDTPSGDPESAFRGIRFKGCLRHHPELTPRQEKAGFFHNLDFGIFS